MKNEKTVIFGSDALESIELSNDCIKLLYANHIATIKELVGLPSTENGVINYNKKLATSAKEIASMVSLLTNGESQYEIKECDNPDFVSYFKYGTKYYPNCFLASTSLLPSIINHLRKNNLIYVSDIYGKDREFLKSIQLPEKKINAILFFLEQYESISENQVKDSSFAVRFTAENICESGMNTNDFFQYAKKVNCQSIHNYEGFLEVLYTDKNIIELSKNIIEQKLEREMFIYHFLDLLPIYLRKVEYTYNVINLLKADEKLYLDDFYVTPRKITLKRYIDSFDASRNKNILVQYLNGATGDIIASKYGIAKQRVFQILDRMLLVKNEPVITEELEIYGPVFKKYFFTCEQFMKTFNADITLYQYLNKLFGRTTENRLPFKEILKDEDINIEYRKRANILIHREYVQIDGQYVKKIHSDICSFILKQYFKNGGNYDSFVKYYYDIVSQLPVEDQKRIGNLSDCYFRDLAIKENVLWVSKDNFKYYDAEENNVGALYKAIDFSKYNNLLMTTRRIFLDYQNLMKKYKIQDCYQLHDLLKKTWNKWGGKQRVEFSRNPTIGFGTYNLDKQLEDLLISVAPIRVDDFAALVHQKYGFHVDTSKVTYFTNIDKKYKKNGKYVINDNTQKDNNKLVNVFTTTDDGFNKYFA